MQAIDIELDKAESKGIAYYRLDEGLKEFLQRCQDEHGIIGFEFEPGSWNFGVILKKGGSDRGATTDAATRSLAPDPQGDNRLPTAP